MLADSGENVSRENHPVWTVYDKLRTTRLNLKYYSRYLASLERQNFWIEALLATIAPSSAISALWLWQTEIGKKFWLVLGGVTAVLAVIKPLLGLTKRIKDLESVTAGYRLLDYDLGSIKFLIEQRQTFDKALHVEFASVIKRERVLIEKMPSIAEKKALKESCEHEVLTELPVGDFFIPED